jgi:hypothetical protein
MHVQRSPTSSYSVQPGQQYVLPLQNRVSQQSPLRQSPAQQYRPSQHVRLVGQQYPSQHVPSQQAPLHAVCPALQQMPFAHSPAQQKPSQSDCPAGQQRRPDRHCSPSAHVLPQFPQVELVDPSTQTLPQHSPTANAPAQCASVVHATQFPAPSQTVPPSTPQALPAAAKVSTGPPSSQVGMTHWFAWNGRSVSSSRTTAFPCPSHTCALQSPAASAVVGVPSGLGMEPHWPLMQALSAHSSVLAAQSPCAQHARQVRVNAEPFPQQIRPAAQSVGLRHLEPRSPLLPTHAPFSQTPVQHSSAAAQETPSLKQQLPH